MIAQLRSEFYKLRSTWTAAGLLAAMLALILLAVLLASSAAAGAGSLALANRGIAIRFSGGDYALLLAGGAAAAALWAVIGLGVGAIVRNQVPTLVGLLAWVLFVENVLLGDVPSIGKFAPGELGQGLAGSDGTSVLHTPALAGALLALWAAAVALTGYAATTRRDFT